MENSFIIDNNKLMDHVNWIIKMFHENKDDIQKAQCEFFSKSNYMDYKYGLRLSFMYRLLIKRNLCKSEYTFSCINDILDYLKELEKISKYYILHQKEFDDHTQSELNDNYVIYLEQIINIMNSKLITKDNKFKPCFINMWEHRQFPENGFDFEMFNKYFDSDLKINIYEEFPIFVKSRNEIFENFDLLNYLEDNYPLIGDVNEEKLEWTIHGAITEIIENDYFGEEPKYQECLEDLFLDTFEMATYLSDYVKNKFYSFYESERYGYDEMLPRHIPEKIYDLKKDLEKITNRLLESSKVDEKNGQIICPVTLFKEEDYNKIIDITKEIEDYFEDLKWEKPLKDELDGPSKQDEIINRLVNIQSSVDRVETKVDNLYKLTQEIMEYKKNFFANLPANIEEIADDIIETFQDTIIGKIKQEFMQNQPFKDYDKYNLELKTIMHIENYEKLSKDSVDFIITAKIMYEKLIMINGDLDYSGVCLLLTKALEKECQNRFYTRFINYMNRKYKDDYDSYPLWCLKYNRKSCRVIYPNEFTLGSVPFALGSSIDKEDDPTLVNKMYDFCKDELFIEKDRNNIIKFSKEVGNEINEVRIKYRNPAAHSDHLSKVEADECFNYLFNVQKLLIKILSNCIY